MEQYIFQLGAFAAERDITLTPFAQMLMVLPVMEAVGDDREFDIEIAIKSAYDLIAEMSGDGPVRRNSQDVIEAFYKRFCKIPPFCRGG